MEQIALPFKHDENCLKNFLEKATKKSILLTITDNSTVMLSIKPVKTLRRGSLSIRTNTKKDTLNIRLHRMFLAEGSDVINEIAEFINDRKKKTPFINRFIRQNCNRPKKSPYRKLRVKSQGKYHDLLSIFNSLNSNYFDGRIKSSITWGTRCNSYSVKKRTLGSYCEETGLIRINPVLDRERVPRYFVEYIVYHEMLHADIGIKEKNDRQIIHSREFRKREKLFKYYDRAVYWEKKNL